MYEGDSDASPRWSLLTPPCPFPLDHPRTPRSSYEGLQLYISISRKAPTRINICRMLQIARCISYLLIWFTYRTATAHRPNSGTGIAQIMYQKHIPRLEHDNLSCQRVLALPVCSQRVPRCRPLIQPLRLPKPAAREPCDGARTEDVCGAVSCTESSATFAVARVARALPAARAP